MINHMNELYFLLLALLAIVSCVGATFIGRYALFGVIVTFVILGNVVVGKLFSFFGVTVSLSSPAFVCIFIASNILSYFFDHKSSWQALYISFGAFALFALHGLLFVAIEGGIQPEMDHAVETIFNFMPRVLLASAVAFLISYHINFKVFNGLCRFNLAEHLTTRNTISTVVANLVDAVIFYGIAFGPDFPDLLEIISFDWLFKNIVVLISLPFMRFLKKYKKVIQPSAD